MIRQKLEQEYRTERVYQAPTPFNEDRISVLEAGLEQNDKNDVMSLRWEANQFILNLWRITTGRVLKEIDGELFLVKSEWFSSAGLTDGGAQELIKTIRSYVNPVFSLAKISYDEAISFYRETRASLRRLLVLDENFMTIDTVHKKKLMADLMPLVWAQISRAI